MPNDDLPEPIPGPELAAMRKRVGVRARDLAVEVGVHFTTFHRWERSEQLDAIRAHRYQKALRSLAERAVA